MTGVDLWRVERECRADGFRLICGADEAGAGPLAGDVYAAAVILPDGFMPDGLNDSKQVSPKNRERAVPGDSGKVCGVGGGVGGPRCHR